MYSLLGFALLEINSYLSKKKKKKKPDSMVPVYNWHSRSKIIPCGANGECPGRTKRPKNGILLRHIKMIIRTTILDGHKVR